MGEDGPEIPTDELRGDLLPRLEEIGDFEHLVAVWLFGSHAQGSTHPDSDVDVACYYDLPRDELGGVSLRLAGRLPARYDAEVFQLLPLVVRKEVLAGEILWTRDEDRAYDVAIETLRAWSSFEPHYREVIA